MKPILETFQGLTPEESAELRSGKILLVSVLSSGKIFHLLLEKEMCPVIETQPDEFLVTFHDPTRFSGHRYYKIDPEFRLTEVSLNEADSGRSS